MLPPVLEIYVIWHPNDARGQELAETILGHFHGTPFTGLIGGAVEVLIRSVGWRSGSDAPRPIPLTATDLPGGMQESAFVAIVPILGTELANAVEDEGSPWAGYLDAIVAANSKWPDRVPIFPYQIDEGVLDHTHLGRLLGKVQGIGTAWRNSDEDEASQICRDLAQGIAQRLSQEKDAHLTMFISHTKRARPGDKADTEDIVQLVRDVIAGTRLREYFDANDLQPGSDFDKELRQSAAQSALLAIRTDLYSSREWCQREVRIAKQNGMPIVIMDAPTQGEERGSFLMDHVPRIPVARIDRQWRKKDVYRALNVLVDECLKRVLWIHQEKLTKASASDLVVSWWAPHAPEPVTLLSWLAQWKAAHTSPPAGQDLVILHPDPPLGADEILVLDEMLALTGSSAKLDIMTPRLLAARGG